MIEHDFEAAYVAAQKVILRYARVLTIGGPEADDITQITMERVWRYRHQYNPARSSFMTWVISIYHRVVAGVFEDDLELKSVLSIEDLIHPRWESADLVAVNVPDYDTTIMVHQALAALGGVHARVIKLSFFGGYTFVEIATMVGLPKRTVRHVLKTGLKRLWRIINDEKPGGYYKSTYTDKET